MRLDPVTTIQMKLTAVIEDKDARIATLTSQVSALVEAIEPFAKYADGLDKRSVVFNDPLEDDDYLHTITTTDDVRMELAVGDLRKA